MCCVFGRVLAPLRGEQRAPENVTHPKTQILETVHYLRFRGCCFFGCSLFSSDEEERTPLRKLLRVIGPFGPKVAKRVRNEFPGPLGPRPPKSQNGVQKESKQLKNSRSFGTAKRGHYERSLFTGEISRISKIFKNFKFSRISRKWSKSPFFSRIWKFS